MGLGYSMLEGTRLHLTKVGGQGTKALETADFPGPWPLQWQQEAAEACTSGARGGRAGTGAGETGPSPAPARNRIRVVRVGEHFQSGIRAGGEGGTPASWGDRPFRPSVHLRGIPAIRPPTLTAEAKPPCPVPAPRAPAQVWGVAGVGHLPPPLVAGPAVARAGSFPALPTPVTSHPRRPWDSGCGCVRGVRPGEGSVRAPARVHSGPRACPLSGLLGRGPSQLRMRGLKPGPTPCLSVPAREVGPSACPSG